MDRDDRILDYLQDRLAPEERAAFEAEMAQDAGLAAEVDLMRSVRGALAAGPRHDRAEAVWDRLSAAMDAAPAAANDNRRPWRQVLQYAAVAVLAVAAWQIAVVPRLGGPQDGFRPASEDAQALALQVRFIDSATLAQIAGVLAPLGGTITDGPGALGIVRVSFADAGARQRALVALQANDTLVEFVSEP